MTNWSKEMIQKTLDYWGPKYAEKGYMRKIFIMLFALILLTNYAQAYKTVEIGGVERRDVIRDDTLQEHAEYKDYDIRIYRDLEVGTDGVVQIFQKGKLVFEEQGHSYSLGASDGDTRLDNSAQIGQDITGNGEPNLVVSQWSGGAHCCFDVYVFSIGDTFRFIDKIEGEHGFVGFKDLDGDGIQEFLGYDWAFAYWNASFAGSPAPEVILRYKDGMYALASDLMKKPLSEIKSFDEIKIKDEELKKNQCEMGNAWSLNGYCIQSDVWSHMLDLIYGGHHELAWSFLDDIWGSDDKSKNAFLSDFKHQLALSDYSHSLPVDLKGHEPNIEDDAEKSELRFKTYQEKMLKHMDLINKEKSADRSLPTINSTGSDEDIKRAIQGWAGH